MSEKRKYTLGEEIFNSVSHGVGGCRNSSNDSRLGNPHRCMGNCQLVYIRCFADYSLHNVNSLSFVYKQKSQGFFQNNGPQYNFSADCGNIHTHYSLLSARRSRLDIIRHSVGCGNIRNCNEFN